MTAAHHQPANAQTPTTGPEFDPAPVHDLPLVTADLPGIGGRIRQRPEDFLVEESPLYQPCGQGEHIYLLLEKKNLSTHQLVGIVARHFGVRRQAVGYAGMKDKNAITRQVMSIHVPGKSVDDFPMLQHTGVTVLWADMHTNKLRLGHLRGNRFSIRIRDVPATAVLAANKTLTALARTGVPNFFGEQRFGIRLNNHRLGRLDLLHDWRALLDELLGPDPDFPHLNTASRACYAKGDYENAWRSFPNAQRSERAALRALMRGATPRRAVQAITDTDRHFWISAFQSAVFNRVVAARMNDPELGLGRLVEGDLAFRHANGAVFRIIPEELEKTELVERLEKFEISPSGPIWGPRMTRAFARIGTMEDEAFKASGVPDEALERAARRFSSLSGQRRAARVPLIDPEIEGGVDEHGSFVRLAFELPAGSFATIVLREIMKTGIVDAAPADDDDEPATESEAE